MKTNHETVFPCSARRDPVDGNVTAGAELTGHVIAETELADILDVFRPVETIEGLAPTASSDLLSAFMRTWPRLVNPGFSPVGSTSGAHPARLASPGPWIRFRIPPE